MFNRIDNEFKEQNKKIKFKRQKTFLNRKSNAIGYIEHIAKDE